MKILRHFAFAVLTVLVITSAAFADDPPSRAVRLKYMAGQVSVQPGGVDEWVAGTINRPMTTADRLWTDKDSRAELHLGTSVMRMNGETSITLTNVSDNTVQVELDQGTLNLRIAHLYEGEIYEVDTPNLAFTITKSGSYRFDVDSNADNTQITAWKGQGEATGDGPSVRLRSHEQGLFSGGRTLAHQIQRAPGFDGFDDWCRVRDEREDRAYSVRYVPRGVIGYEDLDDYGHWVTVAPYGAMWMPAAVATGWAPYRYGHWIWVSPWGWTWVDDAPWGFAPFHYGRWVYYRGGWGWCPGPVLVRPYYAPALVAWVGGSNWGVSLSFAAGGGMAWFPLGYGEPYIPYYQVSRGYFRQVNVSNTRITNITYVTNNYYNNSHNVTHIRYVNQRVTGAVTAVPRDTIINSQPVYRDAVLVQEKHMKGASVITEPEMRPSRHSVLGEHADDPASAPPPRVVERPVVSKMPPPPRPAPVFAHERPVSGRNQDRDRDDHRAIPAAATHEVRPAPVARHEDARSTDHDNADNARRNVPDSVPQPVKDADREEREARRPVPRPPVRDAGRKEVEDRDHAASPAANAAEPNRTVRDNNGQDRNVPRPPEKNGREAEVWNTPTAPVSMPPASKDNSRPGRNVPRPPEKNARQADANTPAAPAVVPAVARDSGRPGRNVPRPPEQNARGPKVRNTSVAPVNVPPSANDNSRPERSVPRPPDNQNRSIPAPQRQAEQRPASRLSASPSTPAAAPRVTRAPAPPTQPTRAAEVSHSAPAPAPRHATPQRESRPANVASRPAPTQDHGAASKPAKEDKGPGKP